MPIGVDFSGATIKAGFVQNGAIVRLMTARTPENAGSAEVLDVIAQLVIALAAPLDTVGVAIPGEVNTDGLCWRLPNTPGFEGVHIGRELAHRLNCPIAVENRATAAALAEWRHGHGREQPSFLVVTFGAGVGGGLVIGGQLFPGSNGFGAEIGHVCVDTRVEAPLCACGKRGCLEAFAGSRALLRLFHEFGGQGADWEAVATSAWRREPAGTKTLEATGRAIGRALAAVQNLLDLGAIVFSGGVASAFDLIEAHVRRELRAHTFAPPLADVRLLVSQLGETGGVLGAAELTRL